MKPSRELDRLIAEKVMGWRFQLYSEHSEAAFRKLMADRHGETWTPKMSDGLWMDANGHAAELLAYSTDIGAAWQIVDKLHEQGLRLWLITGSSPKEAWAAFDTDSSLGVEYNLTNGDTVAHALCLAALKACGAELIPPR